MKSLRPRAVFDCNVFLQAVARSQGPSAECLRLVERNLVSLYMNRSILREVRRVLSDADVRSANPLLTDSVVDTFLRKVIFRGNLVRSVRHTFDYPRDSDDEKYIDLSAHVEADFLVTHDKDLLDLMSDSSLIAKQFRQRFTKLSVITPVGFLQEIRA